MRNVSFMQNSTNLFGSEVKIGCLQRRLRTLVGFQMVQKDGVVFTIRHVLREVCHSAQAVPVFRSTVQRLTVISHSLSVPFGGLQVVVEPSQQNLIRRKSQELFKGLSVVQQPVQLGMDLDINFGEQTSSNDLPDKTKNQVLSAFRNIRGTDVDDGTSDALGRGNDDIVVFGDLESIEGFHLASRLVD